MKNRNTQLAQDYQRIAKAIGYVVEHQQQQPSLEALSSHLHNSPVHLQRLFISWAGVSPKQFLQFLTKQHAAQCLRQYSVAQSSLQSGLSGSTRLHDLMLKTYGMTPDKYAALGERLQISYGVFASPFGECLIASTKKGVCKLGFFDTLEEKNQLLAELHREWSKAAFVENQKPIEKLGETIFSNTKNTKQALHVVMQGSPFQLQVWEALLRIPEGELRSYQDIATAINKPAATRAVSSAIARNPIGFLIPCHRVIRQNADFNQYRWGGIRKRALIGWEAAKLQKRES